MVATKRRKVRKKVGQLEMLDASGTKKRDPRGGKRAGAGRPPKGKRSSEPHKRRQAFKAREPLHVVLRVLPVMGGLRRRRMYRALRKATIIAANHPGCRIVHVSIQRTHVHLLVEAENKTALARGMKSFEISAAKHMNRALGGDKRRRGQVFADRYHAEVVSSPRQARHTLAYVLNNWRKHQEDRSGLPKTWLVDPFSSGATFTGWRDFDQVTWRLPETYEPLVVWPARTWLLREGWRKHGLIPFDEVPSRPRPRPRTQAHG
jgi:REP element-mobilizing transposase RayT